MANRLRVSESFPHKFSGEGDQNPLGHWLEYADYCQIHKLNAEERLNKFKLTLSARPVCG